MAQWRKNHLAAVPLAKRYCAPSAPFARKYTPADVSLLVEMDKAHEDVCGPAVAHLLKRAYTFYGDARYERLAGLSVSHLYNLRKSTGYQRQRASFTNTRPVCNAIACARHPGPLGAQASSEVINDKGKIVKRYLDEDVKSPLECLALLDKKGLVKLNKGITLHAFAGSGQGADRPCCDPDDAKGKS